MACEWGSVSATGHSEYTPLAIPDGMGGAIVVWSVDLLDTQNQAVALQRLSAAGSRLWGPAVACVVARGDSADDNVRKAICPDGSGGAIVVWADFRNGDGDIYAQHVTAAGSVEWEPNGLLVCNAAAKQRFPAVAADGSGG